MKAAFDAASSQGGDSLFDAAVALAGLTPGLADAAPDASPALKAIALRKAGALLEASSTKTTPADAFARALCFKPSGTAGALAELKALGWSETSADFPASAAAFIWGLVRRESGTDCFAGEMDSVLALCSDRTAHLSASSAQGGRVAAVNALYVVRGGRGTPFC